MESIRPVAALPPSPVVEAPLRPAVQPASVASAAASERQVLDPAVSVAFSAEVGEPAEAAVVPTERSRYERDAQTEALVFRVTDMASGDVIVQIPDEVVLRARAYARQPSASAGERIERHA